MKNTKNTKSGGGKQTNFFPSTLSWCDTQRKNNRKLPLTTRAFFKNVITLQLGW